jgi:hypothetical protein
MMHRRKYPVTLIDIFTRTRYEVEQVVGWGATPQAERLRVPFPIMSLDFSIGLII